MKIEEHKFFDDNINHSHNSSDEVYLDVEYDQWNGHIGGYSKEDKSIMLNKDDVIAMAKHFKLTADDLEG